MNIEEQKQLCSIQMGMPTPESAMSASSGAGGLPYSTPGQPGGLGFGVSILVIKCFYYIITHL